MATERDLMKFLKENPPARQFVPYCYMDREADALTVYFEGDPDYSQRLSDHVTLYRSLETKEIVGCRIKGIADLIQDLPNYIEVKHGSIKLSVIFLAFRGGAEEHSSREINNLARAASEHDMLLQTA
jgi:hypothetical protein